MGPAVDDAKDAEGGGLADVDVVSFPDVEHCQEVRAVVQEWGQGGAWAAEAEIPLRGWLKWQALIPHSCGGRRVQGQVTL